MVLAPVFELALLSVHPDDVLGGPSWRWTLEARLRTPNNQYPLYKSMLVLVLVAVGCCEGAAPGCRPGEGGGRISGQTCNREGL